MKEGIKMFKNTDFQPFESMHGDELKWMKDAYDKRTNDIVGENVNKCII